MKPLAGLRVVEAANYLSGPFAGLMLADLGADVVKVEQPPNGDPFRLTGHRANGLGLMFVNVNHGKRTVMIDLKAPSGLEELTALLDGADVFLTNWRPGIAESLGLSEPAVRARHPRLVWVRISGFGQDGPLAARPAFDMLLQARSGLAVAQGGNEEPELLGTLFADKITSAFAAQSAIAAVRQRDVTGDGAVVDVAMLDAVAYFNFPDLLVNHVVEGRGSTGPSQAKEARPLPCRDGWIVVSPVSRRQVAAAFDAVGHPEWMADVNALSDPTEVTRTIFGLLAKATPERTVAEWERIFTDHDLACGPVLDFAGHLADPQVIHNGLYETVDHDRVGPVRKIRHPAVSPHANRSATACRASPARRRDPGGRMDFDLTPAQEALKARARDAAAPWREHVERWDLDDESPYAEVAEAIAAAGLCGLTMPLGVRRSGADRPRLRRGRRGADQELAVVDRGRADVRVHRAGPVDRAAGRAGGDPPEVHAPDGDRAGRLCHRPDRARSRLRPHQPGDQRRRRR